MTTYTRRNALGRAALAVLGGQALVRKGADAAVNAKDYARSACVDDWLHHPVIGDPSWDSFEREPGNPILTGDATFAWPVNGTLMRDPVSGLWYAYVSVYPRGYWPPPPANTRVLREVRSGVWEDAGLVFGDNAPPFVKSDRGHGAHTDASVVYDHEVYHLIYGWCDQANKRGGLGYAWAERPEGPYTCAPTPIHDDAAQAPVLGRYVRAYASTLVRRRKDWLILHMMSTPGNAGGTWGLFAMTASEAAGPYGEPVPLLLPQSDRYHPPLAEFFPAFVHGGRVYAPATSVALNRSFQSMFSAPVEEAHRPEAWRIERLGSLWHVEPEPWEARGIWGQTLAGVVAPDGRLRVMFPCKNASDVGTISIAGRPFAKPLRHGFVLAGPNAPAYAILRRSFTAFELEMEATGRGAWRLAWGCRGPLGSDHHLADSRPHEAMQRSRLELRIEARAWRLVRADDRGELTALDEGVFREMTPELAGKKSRRARLRLTCAPDQMTIEIGAETVLTKRERAVAGRIELVAETGSYLRVEKFRLTENARHTPTDGAVEEWLATEGLAGAACSPTEWTRVTDPRFRHGFGYVSATSTSRAKFNFTGRRCELLAPRGPAYGMGRITMDGTVRQDVSFRSDESEASSVVYAADLKPGRHALVLEPLDGPAPCDCLRVFS